MFYAHAPHRHCHTTTLSNFTSVQNASTNDSEEGISAHQSDEQLNHPGGLNPSHVNKRHEPKRKRLSGGGMAESGNTKDRYIEEDMVCMAYFQVDFKYITHLLQYYNQNDKPVMIHSRTLSVHPHVSHTNSHLSTSTSGPAAYEYDDNSDSDGTASNPDANNDPDPGSQVDLEHQGYNDPKFEFDEGSQNEGIAPPGYHSAGGLKLLPCLM